MTDELVGLAEIASLLQVTKRTASRYAKRADFPEPLGRLASGPVWRKQDIQQWAERNLPLAQGRPPKRS